MSFHHYPVGVLWPFLYLFFNKIMDSNHDEHLPNLGQRADLNSIRGRREIRTLGALRLSSLAERWFKPLTHPSIRAAG